MRIERFEALDATRGMREINARYGDDALIISNSRIGGRNQFVIAIDTPDPHTPVFTAEALVKEFSKAVADRSAPVLPENCREPLTLSDLAALLSAGFDELKKKVEEVRNQATPVSLPSPSPRYIHGESSLQRLMRLLRGCSVPVDLLRILAEVTASCADDPECASMVCKWLSAKLPNALPLTDLPGVHCLVGAPGVGKTATGIRLAAKLSRNSAEHPTLFVAYKLTRESDFSRLQAMAENAGIRVLQADDFSALVTLINEHINSGSLVIELPGHLHASELLRLQQRLQAAQFHLVLAADCQHNHTQYVTRDGALKFSDVMLTKLDSQSSYWPLIYALILYDLPLMLGSYSGGIEQSLVPIDKFFILDEVLRGMSDSIANEDSQESMSLMFKDFQPAKKAKAEVM